MEFRDIEVLWLIALLVPIFLLQKTKGNELLRYFDKDMLKKMSYNKGGISKKLRDILFGLSFIFAVIALARPFIDNGEIKVNSKDIDLITAFDISNSMFCDDVYPNRFEFAKMKFNTFLDDAKSMRVGVIGFSSKAFLISPLTKDFNTLRYLVKNMKLDYVSLKGTSIMSALEVTNNLLKDSNNKALLIFSDGGDKKDYQEEIEYAKKHHITVFIYGIGTDKGGVIKSKNGVLKDKNGDIVIVKRNDAIKELALKSGGAYMRYSLDKNDIDEFVKLIKKKFKETKKKEHTIRDTKELFYYPLALSILLFIASFSSLPRRREV